MSDSIGRRWQLGTIQLDYAAAERFDLVPQPHVRHFSPQPWADDDKVLPDAAEPYFLRSSAGPAFVLAGTVVRPLALKKQSNGRFEIGTLEGSGMHVSGLFEGLGTVKMAVRALRFVVHHCFYVAQGKMAFTVDGKESELGQYETLYVPAGMEFSLRFLGRVSKVVVFSNGKGLTNLMCQLGEPYQGAIIPEKEVLAVGEGDMARRAMNSGLVDVLVAGE